MRYLLLSFLLFTSCLGITSYERGILFRGIKRSVLDINTFDRLMLRYREFGAFTDYVDRVWANKYNFRYLYKVLRRYPELTNQDVKFILHSSKFISLKPLDIDEVINLVRLLANG
jgi:hypothetical protein